MNRAGVSRLDETFSSSQNRTPERNVFHRDNVLWCSKNNGDPNSPLSIERLPQVAKRKICKVSRVKTKTNMFLNRKEDKIIEKGSNFPFFIDKTPIPIEDPRFPKAGCKNAKNMNDSVILLDSPRPNCPISRTLRDESVDIVDLCSESEEELTLPQKRSKVNKKTTGQIAKDSKAPKNDSLDIIVLDDDNESVMKCGSKSAKIIKSTSTNFKTQPSKKNISSKTRSNKIDPIQVQVQNPGPSTYDDSSVVSVDSNSVTETNYLPVDELIAASDVNSNQNAALFNSSKSVNVTSVNVSLPPFIRKLNDNTSISENIHSHPRNVLIAKNLQNSKNASNNVGSNVFNPNGNVEQEGLRPIIIDGCNVAIAHGGDRMFSVRGLCICVEYFLRRGHTEVLALVPLHQRAKVSSQDRDIMDSLQKDKHLVFTPSRYIDKRLIASYDDRYIVQCAAAVGGVIVSRDNYRDLLDENPAWRDAILNRLLMPTWVGDMLMFPVDPLGKKGPTLDEFLRFPKK